MDTIEALLQKAAAGKRLSFEEALRLYDEAPLLSLGQAARSVKMKKSGKKVFYNINRHINLSNTCTALCPLCAFSVEKGAKAGYLLSRAQVEEFLAKTKKEAPNLTEIHIVSSLCPDVDFSYYLDIVRCVREFFPNIAIQAFTPVEIVHFAKISHLPYQEVLQKLKEAGLTALPGGGAEILDDEVRAIICPDKASSQQWIEVVKTAHAMKIPTNASILYGHIETKEQRLKHLFTLRKIQDETHGFCSFLSFPFLPQNTPLAKKYSITPLSAWENLRLIAISRLILDNFEHIKAFWIMLGTDIAQVALHFGADDLDGTVGEEKIMHAAGASGNSLMSRQKLRQMIKLSGFEPTERDSFYQSLEGKNSH